MFGVIAVEKGYIDDEALGRYIEAREIWSRHDERQSPEKD